MIHKLIVTLSVLVFALSGIGCSSIQAPKPIAKNICLDKALEIYPGYVMQPGVHELYGAGPVKAYYSPANLTGTVSNVRRISVQKIDEVISHICMVEFTHELCVDIINLSYCG